MVLRLGDKGSQVRQLQEKLIEQEFLSGVADGIFGKLTEEAVKQFQCRYGLKMDGIVGEATLKTLGSLSIPKPAPPQSEKKGLEWCPFAHKFKSMKTRGLYANGYPKGAVVHFTAGRFGSIKEAYAAIDEGIKNGYAYDCIAYTSELVQARPVNRWGYHAGESAWKNVSVGKLVGAVSDDLIGIEINNAGKLTKMSDGTFKSWFGQKIPENEVRFVTEAEYGCPTGYYHKYSSEQEATLIKYLLWLKDNDPTEHTFSFNNVLGHHEVSGKRGIGYFRKNDPGGALSMTMDQLRSLLHEQYGSR